MENNNKPSKTQRMNNREISKNAKSLREKCPNCGSYVYILPFRECFYCRCGTKVLPKRREFKQKFYAVFLKDKIFDEEE